MAPFLRQIQDARKNCLQHGTVCKAGIIEHEIDGKEERCAEEIVSELQRFEDGAGSAGSVSVMGSRLYASVRLASHSG